MMKAAGTILLALVAIVLSLSVAAPAAANEGHPAFASIGDRTSIPFGHAEFCQRRPSECQSTDMVRSVALDEALWRDLLEVNYHYNVAIQPISDQDFYGVEEFWTYPTDGYGDCEDYALAKRAALIERNWAPSTLLLTVVTQPNGAGHAVLMVRTDRGDFVLDNQAAEIKLWTDTPYTYLKRQSQAHAAQWVDILGGRNGATTVTAGY